MLFGKTAGQEAACDSVVTPCWCAAGFLSGFVIGSEKPASVCFLDGLKTRSGYTKHKLLTASPLCELSSQRTAIIALGEFFEEIRWGAGKNRNEK